MAPKMYYLVDMEGKVTFKVKGVNTKTSTYTYEELCKFLTDTTPITFTKQIQFASIPLVHGSGVVINKDLVKTYALKETKRT